MLRAASHKRSGQQRAGRERHRSALRIGTILDMFD
jgi:hypothetical protein